MVASSRRKGLVTADKPYFTKRERLDEIQSLASGGFGCPGMSVGRYRSDRPIGISTPNATAPMFMIVVLLREIPRHLEWKNGRERENLERAATSIKCYDFRETWSVDIWYPVDSFHAFIPFSALDDITDNLKCPKIDRLDIPAALDFRDGVMFSLVQALLPLLARPWEANTLFTDHVFAAMVTHLATTYGGFKCRDIRADSLRRGMLTPSQEHRVTSMLLDDIAADWKIEDLAVACGLSRAHFMRAFKQTMGMPPHRWLLGQRVSRAKQLLDAGDMPISEIALEVGFADQAHLTRVFSAWVGIGPGHWRRQRRS